jgi:repressor LexA
MSKFAENMRRIRFEKHMTQEEFADLLGTTKQNISRYESGAVSPKISTAASIARKLGVTLNEINGDANTIQDMKRIPILGDTAAGQPIIANRVYDEYITVPTDGKKFDAAVRVNGDSMEPNYRVGDLALIHYQPDVLDGQIAVVCLDDEVTLKRVYHHGQGIVLVSDNPKYSPMNIMSDDINNIHLTGRAIGVIHWEE